MTATLPFLLLATLAVSDGETASHASFAVVIGVNEAIDAELKPLRYADDDAARFFDLFRGLGMRVVLLTRADANTRRLHPQAVGEARSPSVAGVGAALTELSVEMDRAKSNGLKTVLYFVYAGHGNVREGEGYISLLDGRLFGDWLEAHVVQQTGADRVHFIIDACHSYFLAFSRGPGGERREVNGFSRLQTFARHDHVGLLLAASGSWETHEWSGLQAGVFSHEVRSGLYGAADADADGGISYREIAAFVERANDAIPNERFRPRLFARAPRQAGELLDLRAALSRRVEVTGWQHGHWLVEDTAGIRVADFHNQRGQRVWLVRPPSFGKLFVRNVANQREYTVPAKRDVVQLGTRSSRRPRVSGRGAAHHAFSRLFQRPFDIGVVQRFDLSAMPVAWERQPVWSEPAGSVRPVVGWSGVVTGVASAAVGVGFSIAALDLRSKDERVLSHAESGELNAQIDEHNGNAAIAYIVGGSLLAAGVAVLLWPDDDSGVEITVAPAAGGAVLIGRF